MPRARLLRAHARTDALRVLCLAALAGAGAFPACAFAAEPAITFQPVLQPAFASSVPNYVTHCEPGGGVDVSVRANGNPVSVDAGAAQTGEFERHVALTPGQGFTIQVGSEASARTYNVRCLPENFPYYSVQVLGRRQAAYYLTTVKASNPDPGPLSGYVIVFDDNGVPVWWRYSSEGVPTDADLDPNGEVSWAVETGELGLFGVPGSVRVEQRELDGSLVDTLHTAGSPTDFHEAWPTANGDFLIDSYLLREHLPVQLLGIPFSVDVLDASFQEVETDGGVAFSWSSVGHVSPLESIKYWYFQVPYPGMEEGVWDWQHINSVMPYENGYLVSLRNTSAVYYIDAATGDVIWKLGGTHTPQSLRIIGDPEAASDLGSQHDIRAWPDGTISVLDNGSHELQQPRVLRFRINAPAGTATLIQTLTDPLVHLSLCCGSARLLPGGDWVVDWGAYASGAPRYIDELSPTGAVTFRLKVVYGAYRAVPISSEQLSLSALVDAMNAMNPRTPGA
jgi:hypothetical protein